MDHLGYGSCAVVPACISETSQGTEGHSRLNLYGSVTNYRLLCEIGAVSLSPSPWARLCAELSAEAQLLSTRQVLKYLNESQGQARCHQPLLNM